MLLVALKTSDKQARPCCAKESQIMSNKHLESSKESSSPPTLQNPSGPRHLGTLAGESRPVPGVLTPDNLSVHVAGTHVLVSGTCTANARVELFYDESRKFADAVVVGTRWFYYRVWGEGGTSWWLGWRGQGAGATTFFAKEIVDGYGSEPSETRSFTVGKLEKSPVPVMTSPTDGDKYSIDDMIGLVGTCGLGARVDVAFNGRWYSGAAVEHEGVWFTKDWSSPDPRTSTYQARQTIPGFLTSDPSPLVTIEFVRPSDAAAANVGSEVRSVDSPTDNQQPPAPSIDAPANDGRYFLMREILSTGTCEPGALVELEVSGHSKNVRVIGKNWYVGDIFHDYFEFGASRQFRARQRVNGSEFSDWSEPVTVTFDLTAPLIVFPMSGSNHPVGGLFMSGVCDEDATVEVLAEDGASLGHAVVKGTTWVYYREWTKGLKHVRVKQTYRGYTSCLSEVHEFIIR